MPDIAHMPTANRITSLTENPAERFRECFSQARDVLATVTEIDSEMARCLDEMRQQNESPARMIVAQAALKSVREVAAAAKRISSQPTTIAQTSVTRVA